MNEAVIGLGSNRGERRKHIGYALEMLKKRAGEIRRMSALYETAPWGFPGGRHFINAAAAIRTPLDARELLYVLQSIEKEAGRERVKSEREVYSSRELDLDLLYFNADVIDERDLKVPHPAIPERRFVLVPLCDIVPSFPHPVTGKTQRQMLGECGDRLAVNPL